MRSPKAYLNYVLNLPKPCSSVIPTYLPGYRLWSYNVSDYEDTYRASLFGPTLNSQLGEEELDFNANETDSPLKTYDTLAFLTQQILDFKTSNEVTPLDLDALKKKKKKHKKKHKKKKPSPSLPRHTSPDSPSRTNRFLTPLGYVQYYLPLDLPNMNDGWGPDAASFKSNHRPWPEWQIEYSTLDESRLHRVLDISSQSTTNTKVTTLDLPDLTIGSWLQFARQVAKNDKSWNKYERRIYVSSGA